MFRLCISNIHILEVLKLIYPLLLQNDTSLNDFISWCIRKLPRLFFSPDAFLDAKLLEFSLSTYVWKDNAAILLSVGKKTLSVLRKKTLHISSHCLRNSNFYMHLKRGPICYQWIKKVFLFPLSLLKKYINHFYCFYRA